MIHTLHTERKLNHRQPPKKINDLIQGGYTPVQDALLSSLIELHKTKKIDLFDFRVFLACLKIDSTRQAFEQSDQVRKYKLNTHFYKFAVSEIQNLLKQGTKPAVKRSLKKLQELELLTFTDKKIEFTTYAYARRVPFSKRVLTYLCKTKTRGELLVTLSYIIRGMWLKGRGKINNKGSIKVSYLVEFTGLCTAQVHRWRARLIRSKFITKDMTSHQLKLNKHGAYFEINLDWQAQEFTPKPRKKAIKKETISELYNKARSQVVSAYNSSPLACTRGFIDLSCSSLSSKNTQKSLNTNSLKDTPPPKKTIGKDRANRNKNPITKVIDLKPIPPSNYDSTPISSDQKTALMGFKKFMNERFNMSFDTQFASQQFSLKPETYTPPPPDTYNLTEGDLRSKSKMLQVFEEFAEKGIVNDTYADKLNVLAAAIKAGTEGYKGNRAALFVYLCKNQAWDKIPQKYEDLARRALAPKRTEAVTADLTDSQKAKAALTQNYQQVTTLANMKPYHIANPRDLEAIRELLVKKGRLSNSAEDRIYLWASAYDTIRRHKNEVVRGFCNFIKNRATTEHRETLISVVSSLISDFDSGKAVRL